MYHFIYFVGLLTVCSASTKKCFEFFNPTENSYWVGCMGNPGHPNLYNGGWIIQPGEYMAVWAPADWSGVFWARTGCDGLTGHCETGECAGAGVECAGKPGNPPTTLAEFSLALAGGLDYYDLYLASGFNVQMSITPKKTTTHKDDKMCKKISCTHNFLLDCPNELQVKGKSGQTIGCNSACAVFQTDEYCCTGDYNSPQTCLPEEWPLNYAKYFKTGCEDAYSYVYDINSTYSCSAQTYLITFEY